MMMFLQRCYYAVKPLLPWRLRMALRRQAAAGQRRRFADSWPIDPSASRPPKGWPGWPRDRRFAFVITHDVEGPAGLAKCRALAEMEMRLGFRSCFNFIPEGPCARGWLPTASRLESTTCTTTGNCSRRDAASTSRRPVSTAGWRNGERRDSERGSCSGNWTGCTTSRSHGIPPPSTRTRSNPNRKALEPFSPFGSRRPAHQSGTAATWSSPTPCRRTPRSSCSCRRLPPPSGCGSSIGSPSTVEWRSSTCTRTTCASRASPRPRARIPFPATTLCSATSATATATPLGMRFPARSPPGWRPSLRGPPAPDPAGSVSSPNPATNRTTGSCAMLNRWPHAATSSRCLRCAVRRRTR